MSLIQKYIWVIKTIHRSGRITLKELNEKWRQNIDLSRGENLPRQTFDRWKGGILDMFGIVIDCEQQIPLLYSQSRSFKRRRVAYMASRYLRHG